MLLIVLVVPIAFGHSTSTSLSPRADQSSFRPGSVFHTWAGYTFTIQYDAYVTDSEIAFANATIDQYVPQLLDAF